MDDKTLQALTELATKLGTTVEYLWGVLLKQAPIAGAFGAFWAFVFAYSVVWVVRKARSTTASWDEDMAGEKIGLWIAVAIYVFIASVIAMIGLETAVGALLNPEYWALKQIWK